MALQVWCPLLGNNNQQGLSNVTLTTPGSTMSVSTSGKLGKTYDNSSLKAGGFRTSDVVDLGSAQSMFCWFRFTSLTADSSLGCGLLSQHRYNKNTGLGLNVKYVSSTTGYITVSTGTGSSRTYNTYCGSTLLQANTWYHAGFTYDGNNVLKLYINGVCDGTHNIGKMSTPADYIMLYCWSLSGSSGGTVHGNYILNGAMNDARIYDECLSTKEVELLARGLVLHYPMEGANNTLLPIGYQQLDYIEGTGASYFNTNYYFNPETDSCKVTYKANASHNGMILADSGAKYFWIYYYSATSSLDLYADNGSGQKRVAGGSYDQNIHTVEYKNKHLYVDNTDKGSLTATYTQDTNTMWLFAYAANSYVFKGRIYNVYIERNGKPQRCYIPAKRVSDSAIGMYDVANNTFTVSANTAFTAGSVVGTPSIYYDVSGYKYNGSVLGTLSRDSDSARYSTSTSFNGTNSGILIENISLSNIINTSVTYAFWIKPNGESGARSVYFGSYSGTSWSIEKTTANKLRLYWNANPDETANITIADNVWQHIAITKNGTSDVKVYLNGALSWSSTATHSDLTFPTTFRIGRDSRSSDGTPYNGLMSDFRIYATALTATQIAELYNTTTSISNN